MYGKIKEISESRALFTFYCEILGTIPFPIPHLLSVSLYSFYISFLKFRENVNINFSEINRLSSMKITTISKLVKETISLTHMEKPKKYHIHCSIIHDKLKWDFIYVNSEVLLAAFFSIFVDNGILSEMIFLIEVL